VARNYPRSIPMTAVDRAIPEPTPESQPFWDACHDGRLTVQRCIECGEINWFPRGLCRSCSSGELEWVPSTGQGVVYSFSVVRRASEAGIEAPYVLALVDISGGPRIMTHIVDCVPEVVSIEMPVEVRFEYMTDDISLPVFAPVGRGISKKRQK
jgi:uncharacterized OB-fold protein